MADAELVRFSYVGFEPIFTRDTLGGRFRGGGGDGGWGKFGGDLTYIYVYTIINYNIRVQTRVTFTAGVAYSNHSCRAINWSYLRRSIP